MKLMKIYELLLKESEQTTPEMEPVFTVEQFPLAADIWDELKNATLPDINKIKKKYEALIYDKDFKGISIGYLSFLIKNAKTNIQKDAISTRTSSDARIDRLSHTKSSDGSKTSRKFN